MKLLVLPVLLLCGSLPALAEKEPAKEKGDLVLMKTIEERVERVVLDHKTFSKDKRLFAGWYRDGWDEVISIHDAKTGKQLKRITSHGDEVFAFRFSADGKQLAARSEEGDGHIWVVFDVATGKKLHRRPAEPEHG